MLEQGIEVFLPKIAVDRKWKDRTKRVEEPLFRSYIFAHVTEQDRVRVLQMQGIVRTLAFGGKLAAMTADEIEQLRLTQADKSRLTLLEQWRPPVGAIIQVSDGPFAGLKGEVLQQRGHAYVVIRIAALRQAVKVNIPLAWVTSTEQLGAYPRTAL